MALIDSVECVNDEVLTMSPTKFSTFTEMKIDHSGKLAAILFSGEVLCFGSITIRFYHQTMYRPGYCCSLLLTSSTTMPTCLKFAVLPPLPRNLLQPLYNSRT